MNKRIYDIIDEFYGGLYGGPLCEIMTQRVEDMVREGTKWSYIRMYLWHNTSGGGVSIRAADTIYNAFPEKIEYNATGREL